MIKYDTFLFKWECHERSTRPEAIQKPDGAIPKEARLNFLSWLVPMAEIFAHCAKKSG